MPSAPALHPSVSRQRGRTPFLAGFRASSPANAGPTRPRSPARWRRQGCRACYDCALAVALHRLIGLHQNPRMTELLALVVAVALGYLAGRYRVYRLQHEGELAISRTLTAELLPPSYHLLNSVTLQVEDGTTQIDHVLVLRFGVFVIETKHYKGWIFANAKSPVWTQVLFKRKYKFQNPLHQNYKHVKAVQALLDFLPAEQVRSAVVFTGSGEFRTPRPDGVFSALGLVQHLKSFTQEVISENRLQFCVGRLESRRLALTRQTDVEHRASLQQRFGDGH
jgi:restriction system protein